PEDGLHGCKQRPEVVFEEPVYGDGDRILPIERAKPGVVCFDKAYLKRKEHLRELAFHKCNHLPEGDLPVLSWQVILHFVESVIAYDGVILHRRDDLNYSAQGTHVSNQNQPAQPR